MRTALFHLSSALTSFAFVLSAADPQSVTYFYSGDRKVYLTEVTDRPSYRISAAGWNALTPRNTRALSSALHIVPKAGITEDRMAVAMTASVAADASDAIARISRNQQGQKLRVFRIGAAPTLIIENPELIVHCPLPLDQFTAYLKRNYDVDVKPTTLREGQYILRLKTPDHTLWLAEQLKFTKSIPVRYAEVNFWFAHPSNLNAPAPPDSWPPSPLSDSAAPNDPGFPLQWGLWNRGDRSGAAKGADTGFYRSWRVKQPDASGIKVAVLDFAIDIDHPDLKPSIDKASIFNAVRAVGVKDPSKDPYVRELDYVTDPVRTADHGTACAGIIAAVAGNHEGITGIAPGARIMPVQIAVPTNDDIELSSVLSLTYGISAAGRLGARVINLSWGFEFELASRYTSVIDAIQDLRSLNSNRGVLLVGAAGNDTVGMLNTLDFPARYSSELDTVASVAASNWCGEIKNGGSCDAETWSSRRNSSLTITAPGVGILTTTNSKPHCGQNCAVNYRANFSGSSAAAPFVAGVAALVMKANPTWNAARVRQYLVERSENLTGSQVFPRVNVCKALLPADPCKIE